MLPKLIQQVDTILAKRLDKLVVQFGAENPEFVSQYRTARSIVSLGGGRGAAKEPAAAVSTSGDTSTTLPKAA